jgi:hypothetical protein
LVPLFCRTTVPLSPLTVPPTVKVLLAQLMTTLVMLALPTVPDPPLTVHACDGPDGWVLIVTL